MAADSRWSIERGDWLYYLDDTGYNKIERRHGKALMFAGYGGKIQEWKNWIRSNPTSSLNMPGFRGMSVCMVDESSRTVDFDEQQDIVANNVYCAGSGARSAYNCWLTNKCSKRAVETAKLKDYYSGGDVKFIDFTTSETNLTDDSMTPLTIEMVSEAILQRGIFMNINTNSGIPNLPNQHASSSAANDEAAVREEIRGLVASGDLSANAPCDGMHNDWTAANKDKFTQALGKMFGWSN